MTISVNLSAEKIRRLQELAKRNGQDIEEYASSLLEEQLEAQSIELPESDEEEESDALDRAIFKMTNRTPEQIAEAQARAIAAYKPERELPPGQTILDAIMGQWPGDETDEEVNEALKRLS